MSELKKSNRIMSVDMLRGIAALAVTIFHFTNGNRNYLSTNYWLRDLGSVGWAGVEIFFVISGFIIPYSLFKNGYLLKDIKNFLIKRFTRIEPPYFITIVLIIFLNFVSTLSPYYKGQPFNVDFFNLSLHIGYLNAFFGQPWLNPVFWTLAIEFQFYVLMAFLFPLLIHEKVWVNFTAVLVFLGSFFMVKSDAFVFHFSPYFVLGILIFYARTRDWRPYVCRGLEISVLILIYFLMDFVPFFATLIAWLVLSFVRNYKNKFLLFLGTISYSIYLIHIPIGGRLINLSMNFVKTDGSRSVVILGILLIILLLSFFFYKFVEKPALKLANKWGSNN